MSEGDSFEMEIKILTTDLMYWIHPKSPVEPWTPSTASETDILWDKTELITRLQNINLLNGSSQAAIRSSPTYHANSRVVEDLQISERQSSVFAVQRKKLDQFHLHADILEKRKDMLYRWLEFSNLKGNNCLELIQFLKSIQTTQDEPVLCVVRLALRMKPSLKMTMMAQLMMSTPRYRTMIKTLKMYGMLKKIKDG